MSLNFHFTPARIVVISFLLIGNIIALHAQRSGKNSSKSSLKLVGKVSQADSEENMEYVTILLLSPIDSSQITGTVTNNKGVYELEAGPGNYLLKASFIGFETQYISNIILSEDRPFVRVPEIKLEVKTTTLNEVEIVVEKSNMEFALDKKIFNVGKDLANQGGNAADLLDNIPSVSVDIDGNVSLRGNEGVRILVNGKPSSLSGADALKQLGADMIEKVEIITNPSARYEAEGSAGILNIILKKERRKGWNGSFNGTAGFPDSHSLSINLNHRRDKVNFFTSLGGRYRNTPRTSLERRELYDPSGNIESLLNQDEVNNRKGLSGNIRMGADVSLTERSILTGSIVLRQQNGENTSDIDYSWFDANRALTGTQQRNNRELEDELSVDYNLSFEQLFARKGKKFTIDFTYEDEEETENTTSSQQEYDPEATPVPKTFLQQKTGNVENKKDASIRADFTQPFRKDGQWELGYRGTFRQNGNDFQIEEFDEEAREWDLLTNLSNDFVYDEKVHAAYTTVGDKLGKFSYQGGLRMETAYIQTWLKDTDEKNNKNYVNFFPSAFLSYELQKGNNIQISYSRRIRRPRSWFLNPFPSYNNPLSIRMGNPDLDPQYADSYEIGNIKYWDKSTLSSSIYYRHSTGVFSRISTLSSDGVSTSRPENLLSRDDWGTDISWTYRPQKWLDLTWSGNAYYGKLNGENLGFSSNTTFISYSSRLNARFSLKNDVNMQFMLRYRSPRASAQGERKAMMFTDFGINKDILDKKATVSFRMSDLFNTMRFKSETFGDDFYIYREGQWRATRQMYFTFSYRLNQKKDRRRQRNGNGGGGEMEEGF